MRLRIAVTNIQSGIGVTKGYGEYVTSGWRYLLPHDGRGAGAAGAFLKDAGADIALLTEVDGGSRRSRGSSQLDTVSRESGLPHGAFFSTRLVGMQGSASINEGNGLLARFPITGQHPYVLRGGMNPRVLGETAIDIEGTRINAFVAHLALGARTRASQVLEVAARTLAPEGPLLLGGDFNERDHTAFTALESAGLTAVSLAGFPSWKPRHKLQVLFLSRHFTVLDVSTSDGPRFSDHLPLLVEVELRAADS